MVTIVSREWLFEHGTDEHVIVMDCRYVLGSPDAGRSAYAVEHIPNAVFIDMEHDLSGPKGAHGGRHPLPDIQELAGKLGRLGVGPDAHVIAYDDQGGAMAARLWWLLVYMGHDRVSILDGGYTAWKEAGYPVTDDTPIVHPVEFAANVRSDMLVTVDDVKQRLERRDVVLIDSREARRYEGIEETIDKKAGHIPGAINRFWKEGLNERGLWRTPDEQKQRFAELGEAQEVIVYCGSGITACPNVLALKQAGIEQVKLYAGSWSDWISYEDNPVATGKE
ncbi:sulfurtransferase [Paenibacillus sp. YYML68]|uniref:sulfurtransferase n=1 Tax=Paenibacillus sp. YYML68 TaxID=2909250 RepID=UPI0024908AD9|nr:sulfurtransferase [Paenibacillus sp. YYML68]